MTYINYPLFHAPHPIFCHIALETNTQGVGEIDEDYLYYHALKIDYLNSRVRNEKEKR